MVPDLNSPDMMYTFATKLVETNPYVAGCAIAFREDYFPGISISWLTCIMPTAAAWPTAAGK
jgi:hypothetical protein